MKVIKNKEQDVAQGCMTFIDSLWRNHNADELLVYKKLLRLIQRHVDRLESLDPDRNK